MAVALIVAAGRGERLGAAEPKALIPVGGRPMLEWSVAALQAVERVRAIVIALPADRLDAAPAGTIAVPGGATRSESVLAGLRSATALTAEDGHARAAGRTRADEPAPDDEAVIVHDAARIFATPELFNGALNELERTGADAVVAAAPVTDTIKQTQGNPAGPDPDLTVTATVERSRLWSVQTPQVFRRSALHRALTSSPELLAQATDDAWLIEQAGGRVVVLPSSSANFKITTPLDLRLAELVLAA